MRAIARILNFNIMRKPIAIIKEYRELLYQTSDLIKKSGFKDKFIFETLEMSKSNFYRRLNEPELWTLDELERLYKILG